VPNMRCLAIGISDAPPLEFLQGAANGAKAFAKWARSLQIQTEVLTDEEEPVGFDEVDDALTRLLADRQRISRLFIYFAGHGLMRDAGEDLWLLSRWLDDQRAIAVTPLRRRLERYAIDQVTIIGDACRSLANSADSADLVADPVLGRGPFDPEIPTVDILNASSTFHAAYMVPGQNAEDDRCIFSGVLEEALSGARGEAFEPTRGCVTSGSLAKFLKSEVPIRAAQYQVELRPHITAGFLPPDDVYVATKPATAPTLKPWPRTAVAGAMNTSNVATTRGAKRGWSTRTSKEAASSRDIMFERFERPEDLNLEKLAKVAYREWRASVLVRRESKTFSPKDFERELTRRTQEFEASYGQEGTRPTHYESGAGFSIAGSVAKYVTLGRFASATTETEQNVGTWWKIAPIPPFGAGETLVAPLPLLVELANGFWAGAAALPQFIGTFSVDESGVASLIYRRTYNPSSGRGAEAAVARLRSGVLATDAAYDLAARLRDEKEQDPMKGVLAAYLYDGQGDVDSVRNTAWYMANVGIPIPFDMAMLGRLRVVRTPGGRLQAEIPATKGRAPRSKEEETRQWTYGPTPRGSGTVAGVFPWLRQGWALLEDGDPSGLVLAGLPELRKHLLSSQFTTLRSEGGQRLRDIIGEL